MDMMYHYVWELIENGAEVKIQYIPTDENDANPCTY